MKTGLINILFFLYTISSVFVLGLCVLSPFILASESPDTPKWIFWIIYPIALIIIGFQNQINMHFDNKLKDELNHKN